MTTPLGYQPQKGKVVLSKGADWVCTLQAQGQTWPDGTTVSVQFLPPNQPNATPIASANATVTASTATAAFLIQSEIADTIPNQAVFRIYYKVPGSQTTEYAWFIGKVARQDG